MITSFQHFINENSVISVSDADIKSAWSTVYNKDLIEDVPQFYKILKQRPPLTEREIERIWDDIFNKSFKAEHPQVWKKLFSTKN